MYLLLIVCVTVWAYLAHPAAGRRSQRIVKGVRLHEYNFSVMFYYISLSTYCINLRVWVVLATSHLHPLSGIGLLDWIDQE